MCRNGQSLEAIEELYADNVVSREMPGWPQEVTEGIKAVYQKSEDWMANVEELHSFQVSDPIVAENHFSCTMDLDVTFKDMGRQKMSEVCVYQVDNNGKIAHEQFFYAMPG
ncbi:MAG: nuclear transport factor 2 family protein [Flavobacteriaceae bacterium]|nr:nuclear transport factor 2 family protein [Flavobacteriaceae bacterium]